LTALLLALITLAVYLPVVSNGFIRYDDGDYMTENRMVQGGLTPEGVKWAFTSYSAANWHPLTWLSLMLDCELFGVNAAGSHLVNALLHVADTVLLFALWLQLMPWPEESKKAATQSLDPFWPATFIAALFALHPLHVESVAWVAERKDVLSALFGLLTLVCYAWHVKEDKGQRSTAYWLALIFFAGGLMSKPMLVTWPFVMLLLDYWPLQRLNQPAFKQLVVEKIPFFLLTAASCAFTYLAQKQGAVKSLAAVPLDYRLENAPVALAGYLLKIIWPTRLAIMYPMPDSISPAALTVSMVILAAITVTAWQCRKKAPFVLMGWLWFVGTLVPVIGLVKVGDTAMADRYTYIPSIGIFAALAFGAQKFSRQIRLPRYVLASAAILIVGALGVVTERQIHFWHDDEALFSHAIEVTTNNLDAMLNYGAALEYDGKPEEAMAQYHRVQELAPLRHLAGVGAGNLLYADVDMGNLFFYEGKTEDALEQFQQAEQLNPTLPTVHNRIGTALASLGRFSEATNEFYRSIGLDPNNYSTHLDLGVALAGNKDFIGATNQFFEVMRLDPGDASPYVEWARALLEQGRDAEAVDKLQQALQLDPTSFQTLAFTARVLASDEHTEVCNGAAALACAQKAHDLTEGTQPLVEDALGMAYAQNGQFDEAQKAAGDAIRLATDAGMKSETIEAMKSRLELYKKNQPWRESFLHAAR
jgi:tetratricopeptide (TPR) repeat protein